MSVFCECCVLSVVCSKALIQNFPGGAEDIHLKTQDGQYFDQELNPVFPEYESTHQVLL
jgi:hypothetical protein